MTMMILRKIRNKVLSIGPSAGIRAEGFPNSASGFFSRLIGLGSVSVYMSGNHLVEKTDPVFPGLRRIRRNIMPKSTASLRNGVEAAADDEVTLFEEMKRRFLSFKRNVYLKELERYQALAGAQNPKFMVVACVDSRVCPSNILGFQPGEAFMVRNVANLVPPPKYGPSETVAALEFAVNILGVEHIFVVGHSCCAGIEALMRMEDGTNPSNFTEKWVATGKVAKIRSVSAASHLPFDRQCKHCEKESINHSMQNLTMYPWIAEKVKQERLSIHGGYYDFLSCTFEKWTLALSRANGLEGKSYMIKDRQFWS
ncbi:hypothetical protein QQ045_012507 [Rhodiola kirilowii]